MPRLKRAAKQRRAGYGPEEARHLLRGHDWFSRLRDDPQATREAWESLRDELLPAWIADNPGTRPWAWWLFDAPERRRRIDGRPHPFDNPQRNRMVERWRAEYPEVAAREAYRPHYGRPCTYMTPDDWDAEYESEPEYLARLGLLTAEEHRFTPTD